MKILEQVISLLKDDGDCVNLSPIRWLQDPLAKYKKNSDWYKFKEVRERIQGVDVIPYKSAYDYFGVVFDFDLGIYIIRKFVGTYDATVLHYNGIINKVMESRVGVLSNVIESDKVDGWRVRIQKMRPDVANRPNLTPLTLTRLFETTHYTQSWVYKDGYTKDGVFWGENNLAGAAQHYFVGDLLPESIPFKTETEAVNFERSTKTNFYRYLVLKMKVGSSFPINYLPWMGNSINPRTGLKGYESDWTDEDFYEYFDIMEQEQKEIQETMKPYM